MLTLLTDVGYLFNPDTQELLKAPCEREAINRIYVASEDCKVRYLNEEYTAKKGDIIILFYEGYFKNKCIIVNSDKWLENLNEYNKRIAESRKAQEPKQNADCESACQG